MKTIPELTILNPRETPSNPGLPVRNPIASEVNARE
jgi:hypothetical protein